MNFYFLGTFPNAESDQFRPNNTEFKQPPQQNQIQPKRSSEIIRSKSALVVPRLIPSQQQRQRTVINHLRTDPLLQFQHPQAKETPQLSFTAGNLNLKTFKEVDKMSELINSGYALMPPADLVREKQKDEIYKKFWHLKSTGQYHGSLLAKPKVMAPEIRE